MEEENRNIQNLQGGSFLVLYRRTHTGTGVPPQGTGRPSKLKHSTSMCRCLYSRCLLPKVCPRRSRQALWKGETAQRRAEGVRWLSWKRSCGNRACGSDKLLQFQDTGYIWKRESIAICATPHGQISNSIKTSQPENKSLCTLAQLGVKSRPKPPNRAAAFSDVILPQRKQWWEHLKRIRETFGLLWLCVQCFKRVVSKQ